MKAVIALLIAACLAPLAFGQIVRTEGVTADGFPGLKITTSSRATFYVIKAQRNGKPMMVFPVAHAHAVSSCGGVLVVGEETVSYKSQNNPKDDFLFNRADVQQFQVKVWRALGRDMWWRLEVKVKGRDYAFTPLAEQVIPAMEQDFFALLKWTQRAWVDFQGVVKQFDLERANLEVKAEVPKPPPPKPVIEEITTITQHGRKVILSSDGTWKYQQDEAVAQTEPLLDSKGKRIVYQAPGSPYYHASTNCSFSTSLARPVLLEDAIKDHAQHCSLCFSSAPEIHKTQATSLVDSAPVSLVGTQAPVSAPSTNVPPVAISPVPSRPSSPTKSSSKSRSSKRNGYITGPRGGCYYINGNGNKTYVDHSYCR